MIDDPGGHEQRGLERRVVGDMENSRHERERAVQPNQDRDKAQVANGGIGKKRF